MIQVIKDPNLLQKWYVIDSQTAKDKYKQNNSIKFETESFKSNLCDYFEGFILVTGDITVNANHFPHVNRKLMRCFFMKQIISILQCICPI